MDRLFPYDRVLAAEIIGRFFFFFFVEVLVAMNLKVSFHGGKVRRILGTVREQLERVLDLAVVEKLVACVVIEPSRPLRHLIPVPAPTNLAVSNVVRLERWHWGIVGSTHNVLT